MANWDLAPGDEMTRAERRAAYGGAEYGGIEPSTSSPNVFVYSDPGRGTAYGYDYDGWDPDDPTLFLYTGEGPEGDQQLTFGNKAIASHVEAGRALRLFVANGFVSGTRVKRQLYVGEFRIDGELPYVRAEAPGTSKALRSVLVFRLRPVGPVHRREEDVSHTTLATTSSAEPQPISAAELAAPEDHAAATYDVAGSEGGTARRRESDLAKTYQQWLEARGHEVRRWRIRPRGELRDLWTDLFDTTDNVLFEAKGVATRDAIRRAIGQLLDYRRHIPTDPSLAVLLPARPADDLVDLLDSLNIACVYAAEGGFRSTNTA